MSRMLVTENLFDIARLAVQRSGYEILKFYRKQNNVELKNNGSPLTIADKTSHQSLIEDLSHSGIPIVSEEGSELLLNADCYWLIDPLDGTKDFLAANDEFTINVALINDGRPVVGVLYAPALKEMYLGITDEGAWFEKAGVITKVRKIEKNKSPVLGVSRFHDHPDVEIFCRENNISNIKKMGSALKFGKLAVAEIDLYPRLVGSSEWDTAAGQAILEAVGGNVLEWSTGLPLKYGKPKRRNPRLLSLRAPYKYTDFKLQHFKEEIK